MQKLDQLEVYKFFFPIIDTESSILGVVVPLTSADPSVGKFLHTAKNHLDICKFSSKSDADYITTLNFLKQCFSTNFKKDEKKSEGSTKFLSGIYAVKSLHGLTGFCISGPDDAPLVILLHGFGLGQQLWGSLQLDLSSSFRVLAIDFYGHGFSVGFH